MSEQKCNTLDPFGFRCVILEVARPLDALAHNVDGREKTDQLDRLEDMARFAAGAHRRLVALEDEFQLSRAVEAALLSVQSRLAALEATALFADKCHNYTEQSGLILDWQEYAAAAMRIAFELYDEYNDPALVARLEEQERRDALKLQGKLQPVS